MILSVIIPMYNASKYVSTIQNIIAFTKRRDVEFILVDDGSNDDTYSRCQKYFKNKRNVKIYKNDNHGVSFSRNYGISKSSGKFIMFLDSDDCLIDGWDDIVVDTLERRECCDVLYFTKNVPTSAISKKDLIDSAVGLVNKYDKVYTAAPWSKVYNKKFIISNDIWFDDDIIHGEDALFNIKVIISFKKYAFVNKSFYLYNINNNSATHSYDSRFLDSNKRYIEIMEKLLKAYYGDSKNVKEYVDHSFANSVYVYAGKTLKILDLGEAMKAVKAFYSNGYYRGNMKKVKAKNMGSLKKRLIYSLIRYGLFYPLVLMLSIFRKRNTACNHNRMILI